MSDLKIKFEKDFKLFLSKVLLKQLKDCLENARPYEACGIIFGDAKEIKNHNSNYIYIYEGYNFACIQSDNESTVAFLIENIEKLHEIIQIKTKDFKIEGRKRLVSIFHSHPSGAYPSSKDLNQMKFLDRFSRLNHSFVSKAFKNLIWLIMDGTNYDLNGFIHLNSEFFQIEVEIKENM